MDTLRTLRGVIAPVATMFAEDGSFDRHGMGLLIDRLMASSLNGLLFLGSSGEFFQIPIPVRKQIAEFCVARVNGRLPVLIGIAACGTAEVIDLGRHAQAVGADGVIVVNPYYAIQSEERLYLHYRTIAESLEVPVMLYNFPALTGQELTVELVRRLALDCPNIVGIKDTVDCISHTRRIITEVKSLRPDFLVFAGFDEYITQTLMLGGDGVIPASANFAPEIICGLYEAYESRDFERWCALSRRIAQLSRIYGLDTPFFGVIKEAIRMTGTPICPAVVAPATSPSEDCKKKLREVLDLAGVPQVC